MTHLHIYIYIYIYQLIISTPDDVDNMPNSLKINDNKYKLLYHNGYLLCNRENGLRKKL
jgi:hypothetical protein